MQQDKGRPQVVILGGGFGGLETAKALARAPVDVVLLDRENHHCFQPLLYQVATAALSATDVAWPIRGILRHQSNALVLMAEVTGIDKAARRVQTGSGTLRYDYLVVATGVTHSYFGHDEWQPFAPGLKRIEDGMEIRQRLLLAFERAELSEDEAERRRLLTFVIVGGGPTGVEMAGAMAEVAKQTLQNDFRRIDPRAAKIILIEAGPRLLASFSEDLSLYAKESLQRMGVDILLSNAVTSCDARGVSLKDRRIEAGSMIWAAGVAASPAAQWLAVKHDRAGRIQVRPDLTIPDHPEIFAVGDVASLTAASGHPVPGIAPAAKQMGRYVGRLIAARVMGRKIPGPFVYRHYGDLATIGRKSAAVQFGRIRLTGFIGWIFWSVAHIYFLIGVRNRFVVAINWLWSFATLQRGARLITNPAQPPRAVIAARARN